MFSKILGGAWTGGLLLHVQRRKHAVPDDLLDWLGNVQNHVNKGLWTPQLDPAGKRSQLISLWRQADSPNAFASQLQDLISDDYAENHTVTVEGWIFSETEVALVKMISESKDST